MRTLHLISHTHWDREWHQTFQQFRLRLVQLVDKLLDILDSDPNYLHFMLDGQTIVLEDYVQIRPEREADLRRYIQQGRLLIGPWYLLPDEFLTSPEASIRNLLEGDRVAQRFGPKMMIGYAPDTFGHIGQMPQILRGFGIQTASVWRGVIDQPNEFWWQAPDGSRVLMAFLQLGYGNAAAILGDTIDDGFVARVRGLRDQLAEHTSSTDLLLMHGMDHQEAHPGTAAALAYSAGKLDGDHLIHSTLPAYFASVQQNMQLEQLPVLIGELRASKNAPLLPAVLSARMWIKQRNHACETLLEKWAEPFSSWAQAYANGQRSTAALRHPEDALRQAWRLLLQCHPHDSICGCSIDQVHEEMRPRFDQAEQIGEEITSQSLELLADAIMTNPAAALDAHTVFSAVVVFNPSAGPRTDALSIVIETLPGSAAFELVDQQGTALPFQAVSLGSSELINMTMDRREFLNIMGLISANMDSGGGRILDIRIQHTSSQVSIEAWGSQIAEPNLLAFERARQELELLLMDPAIDLYSLCVRSVESSQVRFLARDVPGFGYRTFWVRPINAPAPVASLQLSPIAQSIENEFFTVTAQPDGTLDILDKRTGMLYAGQQRFVDGGDRGDTYNYSPPPVDPIAAVRLTGVRIERSAVAQLLELTYELDIPGSLATDRNARDQTTVACPLISQVTLTTGVARVDIHTEIDNRARDHRLRVHFAAPYAVQTADYDGHFETVQRPIGLPAFDASWIEQPRPEAPQRAFTTISDANTGLLIANRGLPEVEVLRPDAERTEIALTLLRCVGWLSRSDLPERKGPAGPGLPTPGAQMQGTWSFDYAIIPFSEPGRIEAYQQAYAFAAPLRGLSVGLHGGGLPAQGSFINAQPSEFIISAVKITEDKRGWLVRGYNISNQPLTVVLNTQQPFVSVERVNLAEQQQAILSATSDHEVQLEVRAHELASVCFCMRP